MTTHARIRRVSVVRTGQVEIRPDHVESTWRPILLWQLPAGSLPVKGLKRKEEK